jgi:hypothetical protein
MQPDTIAYLSMEIALVCSILGYDLAQDPVRLLRLRL